MYCINCGSKVKDGAKFCGNCGSAVNSPSHDNVKNDYQNDFNYSVDSEQYSKKKKNAMLISILCFFGFIVFFVIIIFVFLFILGSVFINFEKKDYYTLGNTNVESFFKVVDEGGVCGFNTSIDQYAGHTTHQIDITVCDYDNFREEVDEYFTYMIDNYGYKEILSRYYKTIIQRDGNSDYVIEISADLNDGMLYYRRYYNIDYGSSSAENDSTNKENEIEDENKMGEGQENFPKDDEAVEDISDGGEITSV